MSFRGWLSLVTFVLIAVILFFSRHELRHAWHLLGHVNLGLLLFLVPTQLVVYIAGGEMMFSYLRSNKHMQHTSIFRLARISLEGNFVNHVLPSGGVSGVSYLTWRMGHLGVSPGRATMAQVVRHAVGFMATATLLVVALVAVTVDGSINRWIILMSALLIGMMALTLIAGVFLLSSKRRIDRFVAWASKTLNRIVRRVTLGRRRVLISQQHMATFFDEIHHDFLELRHRKELLIKPFLWGIVYISLDAGLFFITFLALGQTVSPAAILIAYSVASVAGFFILTPGGAGAYEAIMVAVLSVAGLSSGEAIAGIVLTRVLILIVTIVFGAVAYQQALMMYGKHDS